MISDRWNRFSKTNDPDLYRRFLHRLESQEKPTQTNVDYLLKVTACYGKESKFMFVASFVLAFDPMAVELEVDLAPGYRNIAAEALNINPAYVSMFISRTKVRYKCIKSFRCQIDRIVEDMKKALLNEVK